MTEDDAAVERLLHKLTRLLAVRECAARLFGRDQKGRDFFARGVAPKVVQADTLSDLTAAYARIARQNLQIRPASAVDALPGHNPPSKPPAPLGGLFAGLPEGDA